MPASSKRTKLGKYTAEGGENYFCRDSGKLFSTDYRCRKPEEE